jgi:hypothetical protein
MADTEKDTVVEEIKENTGVTLTKEQFDALMNRINKLENEKVTQPVAQGPVVTASGVVGTKEKYPVNKSLYEDPRERLYDEKRLSRFNLRENYTLYWHIDISRYQTAQGLWFQEPRFELELRRKDLDEDGNSKGEFVIQKFVGHEDYDAAVDIAQALGIEVDPDFSKQFIDEMRYHQMRLWLEELFFPPKEIKSQNTGKHERVVGGKVVTFYENPKELNRDISGV